MPLTYGNTLHPATGENPAYLLMHRLPRSGEKDKFEQNASCLTKFPVRDKVYNAQNLRASPRWLPLVVIEVMQQSTYVRVGDIKYG